MKRRVPFTKTITFRTMISEITNIEVTHSLELTGENVLSGDILVDGSYKMTDASQIEEEFHYQLPFTVDIDSKYKLENMEIAIGDFYFEIINEEDLKINVEIEIDGLEEKEELLDLDLTRNDTDSEILIPIEVDDNNEIALETEENPLNKLEEEIKKDMVEEEEEVLSVQEDYEEEPTSVSSIFSSLASSEETFSTYYVYIVRESDTIESILDKYKITKDQLQGYNDLGEVKVGSKLIIPCGSNE